MPNYVSNTLRIQCSDMDIMNKIKELIFIKDEEGKQQYSMEKLLPMPQGYSDQPGYSKYGHDWCCSVWGTKWDICGSKVKDSGHTLTLYYDTAWSPNDGWVETLCKYINTVVGKLKNARNLTLQVEHDYWELGIGIGGKLIWKPQEEVKYHHTGIFEYAYQYDRPFYENLIKDWDFPPTISKAQSNNPTINNTNDKIEQK